MPEPPSSDIPGAGPVRYSRESRGSAADMIKAFRDSARSAGGRVAVVYSKTGTAATWTNYGRTPDGRPGITGEGTFTVTQIDKHHVRIEASFVDRAGKPRADVEMDLVIFTDRVTRAGRRLPIARAILGD